MRMTASHIAVGVALWLAPPIIALEDGCCIAPTPVAPDPPAQSVSAIPLDHR